METKRESKLNYLKSKCRNTKTHFVQLSEEYNKVTGKYIYYMNIHNYDDNVFHCLHKHTSDYKYLIKLYNLFMKKK